MSAFVHGRDGLLDFARTSSELGRKRLVDDRSPRPTKRRKVQAPKTEQAGAGAGTKSERRSTRSQSRRDAVQASQVSAKEQIIANSDDAGTEYEGEEEEEEEGAHIEPTDGLVACPVCGKRMKEEVVFTHLDHCTSGAGSADTTAPAHGLRRSPPQQQPGASVAYTPPDSLPASKARERLPTLAYSMLTDTALRKKLQALGIPSQGPKLLLQKRHTEWVNLWNANSDSRDPKPKKKLLEELDVWERTQGRQILQGMNAAAGGQATGVMAKDFDSESWMRGNKNEFEELVRMAWQKKATAPPRDDKQNEQSGGPTSKSTVQEVSRSAGASMGSSSPPSDVALDTELVAGGEASTTKSPFFTTPVASAPKTEQQGDMPGPSSSSTEAVGDATSLSPAKLSMELEQSQSQGSHVNGVLA